MVPVLTGIAGLLLGFAAGFWYRRSVAAANAQSIESRAEKLLFDAEREAATAATRALADAKEEIATLKREADEDVRGRRDEISRQEGRMTEARAELRAKAQRVDDLAADLQEREEKLSYVRSQL